MLGMGRNILALEVYTMPADVLGPVLLLRHDAFARILTNGSTAFFESCTAIDWKACDSVRLL